jgi:hypothetical protein
MSDDTTQVAPVKLCECGCGQPAPIATRTNTKLGHVKGQPIRFVRGHRITTTTSIAERFWRYVDKTEDCWLWTGAKTHGGYGVLNSGRGNSIVRAHRLSWEIHNGPIPEGMDMCHTCDNPSCVNPSHLFLGTPHDNAVDMIAKGRDLEGRKNRARGENHHRAKLTEQQVVDIRAEYAAGDTSTRKLSAKYGISRRSIMFILHRQHWTHI